MNFLSTKTRSEYNAAKIKIRLNREEVDQLVTAFKLFDKNGDGDISLKELKREAIKLGVDIDDKELEKMVLKVDDEGDCRIRLY